MEVKKEMENNPINMKIYFAYGSNLHLEQMKQRCPTAKLLGTGRIENYTLLFRGPCQEDTFLTVEPKQGSFVPVAAFSVEPSDVKALDDYEDVENNLYRIEAVSAEVTGHGMLSGFWYIMNDGQPRLPSDRYWNTVLEGYQDVGFDRALLDEARRECQQNDR